MCDFGYYGMGTYVIVDTENPPELGVCKGLWRREKGGGGGEKERRERRERGGELRSLQETLWILNLRRC
jgi:hypothetical protein